MPETCSCFSDYGPGDFVEYELWGGDTRIVCVTYRSEDIKKGLPGFDGVVVSGDEKGQCVWGYDHQIVQRYAFVVPGDACLN